MGVFRNERLRLVYTRGGDKRRESRSNTYDLLHLHESLLAQKPIQRTPMNIRFWGKADITREQPNVRL
jgi:hypothetical protein